MGVGNHQANPGEPSGDQTSKERGPARTVIGGVQLKAQDLAVAGGVHARRDHDRHVSDPATFEHLLSDGIEPQVGMLANPRETSIVESTTVLLLPEFLPDLVVDDAVVFSFNELQIVVRTPPPADPARPGTTV